MQDRKLNDLSEIELLDELTECISLEGEAKARAEPIRRELLNRQVSTGETRIEHNGWQSDLKRETISAAWVERQYGYPKNEIPASCFTEEVKLVLDGGKVGEWLTEQGHEVKPSYTLAVSRKKLMKA
ncbi:MULTISPECIES: hypothetical protein [Rhizobium]|uniref:hypothetical protein n=1 Tax=Rhizobium TaxID=379 RepID=UPI0013BC5F4E|nr:MULTISPECIES: hypothetical protein [Rhizobium]MBB4345165.1 hypothetical protein [Rhizobium leguminosarum]MBB6298236.1 hypothetical protein [Rhizobium leguminosarum]NEJ15487.1 hypothetical protein [Rhizobium ruizarguesonis]NEK29562.1 hypothetical protein [Rhizobium ruizarguesonis]